MATFLTNSKMDPALKARIESSVRGHKRKPGTSRLAPRLVGLVRVAIAFAIVSLVGSIVMAQRRTRDEIDHARAALLVDVQAKAASLTPFDKECLPRAESWLTRFAGTYEGDFVAPELRLPGAWSAVFARPSIYVRGPMSAFSSAGSIAELAATSAKDPLVECLADPPHARTEKALLPKSRIAYAGGAAPSEATANVRRLHDAEAGLPILLPPWSDRVRRTDDPFELAKMRKELEKAPIDRAKEAARATLFLFAIDEPGDDVGPTELDGERAHSVRVGLVDLASGKVLLRLRKTVDPKWISLPARPTHASALDSCALALDVLEATSEPSAASLTHTK